MKSDRIVWTNMPLIVLFAWCLSSIYMCYKFRIFLKEINLIIWILFTLNDWRIEFFIILFIFDVYLIFSLRILPIWVLFISFLNYLWLFGSFWHWRKLEIGLIIKRYLILWLWIFFKLTLDTNPQFTLISSPKWCIGNWFISCVYSVISKFFRSWKRTFNIIHLNHLPVKGWVEIY